MKSIHRLVRIVEDDRFLFVSEVSIQARPAVTILAVLLQKKWIHCGAGEEKLRRRGAGDSKRLHGINKRRRQTRLRAESAPGFEDQARATNCERTADRDVPFHRSSLGSARSPATSR